MSRCVYSADNKIPFKKELVLGFSELPCKVITFMGVPLCVCCLRVTVITMLKFYKNVSVLIAGRKPTWSNESSYLVRRLGEFSAGIGGVKFNLERSPGMPHKHRGAIYTKISAICQKRLWGLIGGKQLVFLYQPHVSCFSSTAVSHASCRDLGHGPFVSTFFIQSISI